MATRRLLCLLVVAAVGHAGALMAAEAPGDGERVVTDCWKSVMETPEPCERDVLRTLVRGTLHLSKDCCAVLGRVGERCVVDVISSLPLGQAYLPIVNQICGLVSSII